MTLPLENRPLLDDYPTDLTTAARLELVHLWNDLAEARRNANRGCWSMGCEDMASYVAAVLNDNVAQVSDNREEAR